MLLGSLLLQNSIVDAEDAGDGGSCQNALVATVDGAVDAVDGLWVDPAAEGDALAIDDEGNDGFDNAISQRIDHVIRSGGGRATRHAAMVGTSGQIYEVTDETRENDAREGP